MHGVAPVTKFFAFEDSFAADFETGTDELFFFSLGTVFVQEHFAKDKRSAK
jgi:hypothetical protein